jgi:flagellar assembly protein FliH
LRDPHTGFVPAGAPALAGRSHVAVAFRPAALDVPDADGATHEAARAAGFAAGYAAGARQAAADAAQEAARVASARAEAAAAAAAALADALEVLRSAAAAARARTVPVLAEAEALLHAGALELARAVLGVELDDADRSATAALARVLDRPHAPEAVTIHLHPRDLAALRACGADEVPDGVELVADPSLAPGDAVSRHPDGFLDARIGAALERAAAALAGEAR